MSPLAWVLFWAFTIGAVAVFVAIGLGNFDGEKIARYLSDGRDPDPYFIRFIENAVFFVTVAVIVGYLIIK